MAEREQEVQGQLVQAVERRAVPPHYAAHALVLLQMEAASAVVMGPAEMEKVGPPVWDIHVQQRVDVEVDMMAVAAEAVGDMLHAYAACLPAQVV